MECKYLEPGTELLQKLSEEIAEAINEKRTLGSRDTDSIFHCAAGMHQMLYRYWQILAADYDYFITVAQEDPAQSCTVLSPQSGSRADPLYRSSSTPPSLGKFSGPQLSKQVPSRPSDWQRDEVGGGQQDTIKSRRNGPKGYQPKLRWSNKETRGQAIRNHPK